MVFPKRRTANDPIVIEVDHTAQAPVERIFELLDFAAHGHALRERGYLFLEEPEGALGRYRVVDPSNPDCVSVHDVDLFDWPARIRYETFYETGEATVPFQRSISDYALSSSGAATSTIRLVETVFFRKPLSRGDYRARRAMLLLSVQRHLMQLCMHAARGVDAAGKIR